MPSAERDPQPLRRARRIWAMAVLFGTLAAAGAGLWAASYPSGSIEWGLAAYAIAVLTAAAGVVLLVVCIVSRRFSVVLVVAPLIAAAMVPLAQSELPLQARFALARPALERALTDVEAGEASTCASRIGSYRVSGCYRVGETTYFRVPDGGFLDTVGFAHHAEGTPTAETGGEPQAFRHLTGPWHTYAQSW